jgi:predicted ATPase
MTTALLRAVRLVRDDVPSFDVYPFALPVVRGMDSLDLDARVTFFVGENGSGKSTLLEAIAVVCGFNAEGGSGNMRFSTRASESELHRYLRPVRGVRRWKTGYFLRAESYFNVATQVDQLGVVDGYGGKSLHEQSHGESFLALLKHRFGANGLYLLDEPEAALSPSRQLSVLEIFHDLVARRGSQLIIATHSPILLAYPGARIYSFGAEGIRDVAYEDTEHYQITRDFLVSPGSFLRHLLGG